MKKIALYILLSLFVFVPMLVPFVQAEGLSALKIVLSTASVKAGESFTTEIYIEPNSESIDTVRIELGFDPTLFEGQWFDIGSAFPSLSPGYEINNTDGVLTFGAFKYGTPVTQESLVATMTFRALADAEVFISILDGTKLISDGEEMIDSDAHVFVLAANTQTAVIETQTSTVSPEAEAQALVYFGAFYARMPQNGNDWAALHCIAYGGCQGSPRDLEAEQHALILFGQKYAKMPATSIEWNVLHTIAYTDLLTFDLQ